MPVYRLTTNKITVDPQCFSLHEGIHGATSQMVALINKLGLKPAGNLALYRCEATGELIELSITQEVDNGTT